MGYCKICEALLDTGPCAICKNGLPDKKFVRFSCEHKYHVNCWLTTVNSMFSDDEKQILDLIDTQLTALFHWIEDPTSKESSDLVRRLKLNKIFNPSEATKKKMEELKKRLLARRALLFGKCPCCEKDTFPQKYI